MAELVDKTSGERIKHFRNERPGPRRQWRAALTSAADALSLDEVHDTLES